MNKVADAVAVRVHVGTSVNVFVAVAVGRRVGVDELGGTVGTVVFVAAPTAMLTLVANGALSADTNRNKKMTSARKGKTVKTPNGIG